ncbi:hypothetical protein [Thiohalorhabdus methylotrophus]|uniref:Tetratricopeptide repeat protein n=1 Tax=Thiohalorhabdus methylotrophus TaxID=3242694 RepID=A0ABV4TTZ8_9GAMM
MNKALVQVEQGKYEKADKSVQKSLDPTGDDQLLYHLELGTIHHLAGSYEKSNKHLEQAHDLADSLRSKQAEDYLAAAMVSPREMTYMGSDVERVYISYYKALNYLMLAQQAKQERVRDEHLEKAGVEVRRLDNTLSTISFDKGNYKDVKDKEEKTFTKLLDLFQKFQGNWLDEEWLVFREDAYARYLAGVLYEKRGNLDDARISYQKAAELYEEGYTKQYHLGGGMAEQAWFDAIRMMRRSGGWEGEWPRLAEEKLSESRRARLDRYDDETAQILVIQHLGMVPQRKELNLRLTALPQQQSLLLRPVLTGDGMEEKDQLSWFFLLYGDKGVLDLLNGYREGGLYGVARNFTSKTVPLGPAWDVAEQLKIPQTLGSTGIRVTVPYYSPLRTAANGTRLLVDGEDAGQLLDAESLAQLTMQEQLLNASSDLYNALARATLKNVAGSEAGGMVSSALGGGEGLGSLAGKLLASGSSAAETRNWLTLPYGIRLMRVAVEPGKHHLELTTLTQNGSRMARTGRDFELAPGEVRVWVRRTIDRTQERPDRESDMKTASN